MGESVDLRRREVLRTLVTAPAAATLGSMLWGLPQAWAGTAAALPDLDPVVHFLRRTSFGIRAADLTAIRASGIGAYLETQLASSMVNDTADAVARARYPLAHLTGSAYWRTIFPNPVVPKGGDFAGHWPAIAGQVMANQIYRALFSKRQLFEVMVQFWSNHLNTFDPTFKGAEQQTVIRANALGNFKTMIGASQRDTAMSRYLNNGESRKPTPNQNYARELLELHTLGEGRGYGQPDVLALSAILSGHTWDRSRTSATFAEYTYLPSWHVNGDKVLLGTPVAGTGQSEIDTALSLIFSACAPGDAVAYAAQFVAFKLCRHFVSDLPGNAYVPDHIGDIQSGDLVTRAAAAFYGSGYDIKTVLRYILKSPEFSASADQKFARPMEAGVGLLRTLDVSETEVLPDELTSYLQKLVVDGLEGPNNKTINRTVAAIPAVPEGVVGALTTYVRDGGNLPGYWPTPDGYPDKGTFWGSATQFITRWNYIAAECERDVKQEILTISPTGPTGPTSSTRAARRVPNVAMPARQLVRLLASSLLHRNLSADHETVVAAFVAGGHAERTLSAGEVAYMASAAATVLLSSPYMQLR
ncbi:MAG TPA: DUF1800 domain-containing protein [Verrucomicrobiae bacterium]|nr:DUF1800 domain-containing protein [Verrucomicrobiae bacterium]